MVAIYNKRYSFLLFFVLSFLIPIFSHAATDPNAAAKAALSSTPTADTTFNVTAEILLGGEKKYTIPTSKYAPKTASSQTTPLFTLSQMQAFQRRLSDIQLKKITQDSSIQMLNEIFGVTGFSFITGPRSFLGLLMKWFNLGVLSAASILIGYVTMLGVMETSREGRGFSQAAGGFNFFSIFRVFIGTISLMPTVTGYSLAQFFLFWVIYQGVVIANSIWDLVAHQYEHNIEWLIPQFQNFQSFLATLPAGSEEAMNEVTEGMVATARTLTYNVLVAQLCDQQLEANRRANSNLIQGDDRVEGIGDLYYQVTQQTSNPVSIPYEHYKTQSAACHKPGNPGFSCGTLNLKINKKEVDGNHLKLWVYLNMEALRFLNDQMATVATTISTDLKYRGKYFDQLTTSTDATTISTVLSAYVDIDAKVSKAARQYVELINYAKARIYQQGGTPTGRTVIAGGWASAGSMYGDIISPPKRAVFRNPVIYDDQMSEGVTGSFSLDASSYTISGTDLSIYGPIQQYGFVQKVPSHPDLFTKANLNSIQAITTVSNRHHLIEDHGIKNTSDMSALPSAADSFTNAQKSDLGILASDEQDNTQSSASSEIGLFAQTFDALLKDQAAADAKKGLTPGQKSSTQTSFLTSVKDVRGISSSVPLDTFLMNQVANLFAWNLADQKKTYINQDISVSYDTTVKAYCPPGMNAKNCLSAPLIEYGANDKISGHVGLVEMMQQNVVSAVKALTPVDKTWVGKAINEIDAIAAWARGDNVKKDESMQAVDKGFAITIAKQYQRTQTIAVPFVCAEIPLVSLAARGVSCSDGKWMGIIPGGGFKTWPLALLAMMPYTSWNNQYGGAVLANAVFTSVSPVFVEDTVYRRFQNYIYQDIQVFLYQAASAWFYAFMGKQITWITMSTDLGGLGLPPLNHLTGGERTTMWNPILAAQRYSYITLYACLHFYSSLSFDVLFANLRTAVKYMLKTAVTKIVAQVIEKDTFGVSDSITQIGTWVKPVFWPFPFIPFGTFIWIIMMILQFIFRALGAYFKYLSQVQELFYSIEVMLRDRYIPLTLLAVTPLMTLAGFLAIYLPALPFLVFTVTVVGWLLSVIEAVISIPIVAIGMTHPKGHDFLGKAEQLMILILGVFIRPAAIIIGFIFAIILSYSSFWLFNTLLVSFLSQAGVLHITLNSSVSFGVYFQLLFLLLFYTYTCVAIVNQSFSLVYRLPAFLVRWIGGSPDVGLEEDALGEIQQQTSQSISSFASGANQTASASQGMGTSAIVGFGGTIGGAVNEGIK